MFQGIQGGVYLFIFNTFCSYIVNYIVNKRDYMKCTCANVFKRIRAFRWIRQTELNHYMVQVQNIIGCAKIKQCKKRLIL